MELTQEILNDIKRKEGKAALVAKSKPETVLALVAEIERLRTELATMNTAPATKAPAVASATTRRPTLGDAIDSVISTGDKVRVTKGVHKGVTVTAITVGSQTVSVTLPNGHYEVLRRDAIKKL